MNEYVEILKRHVAENPPNYGSDANSILEMLFSYYHECNNTDTDAVKAAFEDLYQRMHGMPLREIDRIVDAVCALCREHDKAGFVEGVKVGLRSHSTIYRNQYKSLLASPFHTNWEIMSRAKSVVTISPDLPFTNK